jgi:hypothetical protein
MDSEMGNTSFISTLITAAASLFLESRKAVCPLARAARSRAARRTLNKVKALKLNFPAAAQHHAAAAAAAARIMT